MTRINNIIAKFLSLHTSTANIALVDDNNGGTDLSITTGAVVHTIPLDVYHMTSSVEDELNGTLFASCLENNKQRRNGWRLYNYFVGNHKYDDERNSSVDLLMVCVYGLLADDLMYNTKVLDGMTEEELVALVSDDIYARYSGATEDYDYVNLPADAVQANSSMALTKSTDICSVFTKEQIVDAMTVTVKRILGRHSHRGVPHAPETVTMCSVAAITADVQVRDKKDEHGNVIVFDFDGFTHVPEFVFDKNAVLNDKFPTVTEVDQRYNHMFKVMDKFYNNDFEPKLDKSYEGVRRLIYVTMQGEAKDQQKMADIIEKMEANGDTNNPVYRSYKTALRYWDVQEVKEMMETMVSESLLLNGFFYNGLHYTYCLSTQSQFRAGVGTFMLDPYCEGWFLTAKFYYKLTACGGYDADVAEAKKLKGNIARADFLFHKLQEKIDNFHATLNGNTCYEVALSKVLGRVGLQASTSIEIAAVAARDHSEWIQEAYNDLASMKAWIIGETGGSEYADEYDIVAHTIEFTPIQSKTADPTHKTHTATIKRNQKVTVHEKRSDGRIAGTMRAHAALSLFSSYISGPEYGFFKEHWADYHEDTTEVAMVAAEKGDDEFHENARTMKRIIKKIRSCFQLRIGGDFTGSKGMDQIMPFEGYSQSKKILDKDGVPLSEYDFIFDPSTIKYKKQGAKFDATKIWIVNTNKTNDQATHKTKMSAQYIANLAKWTSVDAKFVVDETIAPMTRAASMIATATRKGGTPQQQVDALLELGAIGRENNFSTFNQATELAKANKIMFKDKTYLEFVTELLSRTLANTAKGSVPVIGDYLVLACCNGESYNGWFGKEMKALGLKPRNTLREEANKRGITGPVCYTDGYVGKVAANRSPAYTFFQAVVLEAFDMEEYWYCNDCIMISALDGTARKLGDADHDGDKVSTLRDINDVNHDIIEGIDTNAVELRIDPEEIEKAMGDKRRPKMAMTVANNVKLLTENLRKSMIGRICKWNAAFLALYSHLAECERIATENGCKFVDFRVPAIKKYSWTVADPSFSKHDEWHNKAIAFLRDDTRTADSIFGVHNYVDKDFRGYEFKGDVLYVEGYVEHHYNKNAKKGEPKYVPTVDKATNQLVGLYGRKDLNTVRELMEDCLIKNYVNTAAGSIEIDATNNGFHSFFHEKANFMAIHELFRDFMKNKKLNKSMVFGSYLNISPLGVLFTETMKRWNEVMDLVNPKGAVNLVPYMTLLLKDDEIQNVLAERVNIERIRENFMMEQQAILDAYDDDDEDNRIEDMKTLQYKTRNALYNLTHSTYNAPSARALALATWVAGNGSSFSFLMAEELRELLKDDPKAMAIEKLPKMDKKVSARLVNYDGGQWLTINYDNNGFPETEMVCKTNGIGGKGNYCFVTKASDGDSYAVFMRKGSESTPVYNRSRNVSVDDLKMLSISLVGTHVDGLDKTPNLRNFVDSSIKWSDGKSYAGFMEVKVYMDSETDALRWKKTINGKVFDGLLKVEAASGSNLPSFAAQMLAATLNNKFINLDMRAATAGANSYNTMSVWSVRNF